jgi:hypothetical protein
VQKFAVNLLYQNTPTAKPKMDLVIDSKASDTTTMVAAFQLLQDRLLELAKESIPAQSSNPYWKNRVNNVVENFPKLLKPGKEYTKDGVSGQYDPSIGVSLRVPNEKDLGEFAELIAAYQPPHPDKISKGYSDNIEVRRGASAPL